MGSIYKKGRDGYYYYQAYVKNSVTGKKDKRVYHSLSTKDEYEAIKLKKKYDQKYEKAKYKSSLFSLNKKKVVVLVVVLLSFAFLSNLITKFNGSRTENFILSKDSNSTVLNDSAFNFKTSPIDSLEKFKKNIILNSNIDQEKGIKSELKNNTIIDNNDPSTLTSIDSFKSKVEIPPYTIQRIDRLSGGFQQGKIYINVDKNIGKLQLEELCYFIRNKYDQFTNIIICIYSNNRIGVSLSKGDNSDYNNKQKKENWLAFYSFNAVEGDYFDDNPTGYLGNLNSN